MSNRASIVDGSVNVRVRSRSLNVYNANIHTLERLLTLELL